MNIKAARLIDAIRLIPKSALDRYQQTIQNKISSHDPKWIDHDLFQEGFQIVATHTYKHLNTAGILNLYLIKGLDVEFNKDEILFKLQTGNLTSAERRRVENELLHNEWYKMDNYMNNAPTFEIAVLAEAPDKTSNGNNNRMENMLAHITEDVTTIRVEHATTHGQESLTFKATRKLADECVELKGEESKDVYVAVKTRCGISMGRFVSADDEPNIDPKSDMKYQWAFSIIDTSALDTIEAQEAVLVKNLCNAQKRSMRERVRSVLGISDTDVFKISS